VNAAESRIRDTLLRHLAAPGTDTFEDAVRLTARDTKRHFVASGGATFLVAGVDQMVSRVARELRAEWLEIEAKSRAAVGE